MVDGLRIDHPDGLADPAGYLERLRDGGAAHVWVEKILDPGEPLRDWPVEGTVGYEFLNDVAALFVDPAGEAPLTALWEELSGDARPFGEWAAEAKLEQARTTFAPDVDWLRRLWPDVEGLEEALAALPVYRTYIRDLPAPEDLHVLREAGLRRMAGEAPREFVTRFQQTTPPVMAKGVEDTAFYRYVRLLALNDVGGDPSRWSIAVDAFHAGNARARRALPAHLLVAADARHEALGRRPRADRRARRAGGRVGGRRAALARAVRAAARGGAPDADRGVHDLPDAASARGRSTPSRLCAYMEKALREAQAEHELGRAGRRAGGARDRVLPRALRARAVPRGVRAVRRARRRARRAARAAPDRAQAHRPGRARHLPGRRARRALARRPRQPPAGRLGAPRARCSRELRDGRRAESPDARKLWLIRELLALRARRPGRVRGGAYTPLDAARTRSRSCAATRSRSRCRSARAGSTPGLALPGGAWRPAFDAELLPGRRSTCSSS